MQARKGGVPSFGLPRFPAAYCTVTIMSFFVLLSAAPIDIVMVLSFSAVGASSWTGLSFSVTERNVPSIGFLPVDSKMV